MGNPVVDEERDSRIRNEVVGLLRFRVGGHDDDGRRCEGCRGQVGVVHQRDMRNLIMARRQVELRPVSH